MIANPAESRRAIVLIFVAAAAERGRLRGGSQGRRDRWYGVAKEPDFSDFKRWFHRVEKPRTGDRDLESVDEARTVYDEWVSLGRAKAR